MALQCLDGGNICSNALMFAVASYLMNGGVVPECKEDGQMTIEEIANQDLENVDLAVISASNSY